ncbi:helix-turn-helix domain-containing protein [Thermoactinomyces sp. CICC 10520]|jgi:DNA-binding XRE family transcriptional regulator|uniref:helix-turn-helix domain-containing protein n=1 Tax=Thermoactinomyces sp. CICC 10520 TaxID=2767433 RepID=UPI0018DDFAB7|nr:helix-turn-helix transcriptional regulator [Thermoactinomyces sp. CICC 10520]MBH8587133.1 helix-turn-helix domain-containing protein [Thermoactinomyces sp. CICC 10520]
MKIKSEEQYRKQKAAVEEMEKKREQTRRELEAEGADEKAIQVALFMMSAMYDQMKFEVEEYERVKRGEFDHETVPMHELGSHLVKLRIWKGITQSELAKRLGISQPQISKDERNEYQGISIAKANRILRALGIEKLTIIPGPDAPSELLISSRNEMAATRDHRKVI